MPDTKISLLTDAGALTGAEIVPLANGAANERTTTQAIADLAAAGGSGLYSPVLSAVPTSAGTGLGTWVNQGVATVADRATGISIACAGSGAINFHLRTKAAPATPYTVNALVGITMPLANFYEAGIGWYDGTNKIHAICCGVSTSPVLSIRKANTPTSNNGNDITSIVLQGITLKPIWLHLVDDGTNVKFGYSTDGVPENAFVAFSVAKASGFLGSGGYTNLAFMLNPHASSGVIAAAATLMSWQESAGAAF